jgi:hypothetical protein
MAQQGPVATKVVLNNQYNIGGLVSTGTGRQQGLHQPPRIIRLTLHEGDQDRACERGRRAAHPSSCSRSMRREGGGPRAPSPSRPHA